MTTFKKGDKVLIVTAPVGGFTIEYLHMVGEIVHVDQNPDSKVPYIVKFQVNGKQETSPFCRNRFEFVNG